jgi:hypothetical protein
MADILCRVRFGARPLARAFRAVLGSTVRVRVEFLDPATLAGVSGIGGVSLVATKPDLSTETFAQGALTADGVGAWYLDLEPNQLGSWLIRGSCTTPQSEAGDALLFVQASAAESPLPPPPANITIVGEAGSSPVQSVAGRTGAVVLAVADISGAAPLASPALTGNPTAPTQATANNSTRLATTAYVKAQGYVDTAGAAAAAPVQSVHGRTGTVTTAAADITDSTAAGRAVLTAADATAQRSALGLGTAATSASTAFAAATHTHPASAISDSTAAGRALLTGADAAAQRSSLGLGAAAIAATTAIGLSLLAAADAGAARATLGLGSAALEAAGAFAAAAHTHPATAISDSTAAGRAILTGADAAAQRSSLGLTATATAASTTFGRTLINAADAAAARTELGLGTAATSASTAFAAASHTHTASAVTDFTEAAQDVVGGMIAAAGGTYNDAAGTITLPSGGTIASTAITDSTAAGRALLTAADAAAQRTALGLTDLATAASTSYGRSLVNTADAAAARFLLGVSVSGNFADGTASAPGAPWLSDTNTGFYRPGADVIGFAAGGAAVATMTGVAAAANSLALSNAPTTIAPSIAAVGLDANIDLAFTPKGTGYLTTARPFAAPRFFSSKAGGQTTISYGGTIENLEDSGFFMSFRLNGTVHTALTTYEQIGPMKVSIFDQAIVTLSNPANQDSGDLLAGWNLEMTVDPPTPTEAGVFGKGRIGMRSAILAGSLVGNAGYLPIVGMEAKAQTNGTQGGVGGWDPANSIEEPKFYTRGAIFGLNSLAIISNAAATNNPDAPLTHIGSVQSIEANWSALNRTSVHDKVGLRLVPLSNDIVQGLEVDAGITLSVKGSVYGGSITAAPIRTGIQFGVPSGFWPFNADSIAIAAVGRGSGRGTIGRPATIPGVGSLQTNLPIWRFLDIEEVLASDAQIAGRGFRLEPLGDLVWTPRRITAPTLTVNGQLCIYAVSDTAVRIRMRGNDGVTRESGNLNLT